MGAKGTPWQLCHRGAALAWFLLVVAAHGQLRQLQQETASTTEAPKAETQAIPNGMRLKEAHNGSVPIRVIPNWDLFLGFDDKQKTIRGKLTLLIMYFPEALRFVSDPQKIVSVDNFGAGDRYLQGSVQLVDPETGKEAIATSNIYVGEFSQSQGHFDHYCYPFDNKKVKFELSIQRPGDFIFSLALVCPEPLVAETRMISGESVITKCSAPTAKGSFLGFDWGEFACERINDQQTMCYVLGARQWLNIFKGHVWPALAFSAMGFISFALSVKMAMPRIATTMLALISLTNLRNTVMGLLPASGSTSWLEEYFLISMTFMLLNLCGHAFSFYLDSLGKTKCQSMANKVNFYGMISICNLVVLARLHVRECPQVDRDLSTALVILSSLLVVVTFALIAWFNRLALREAMDKLPEHLS